MGLRKRIGLAAGLLALGVGIFATKTWVEARSSIRRATDHWVDNASLPVSVRPITPAPTPFQPVPMEPAYTSAIAFDGDLWFSGRGGLERRNSSTGELLARWRVGTELPPAPLTALVMARLGPASEPRLLAATAGEGLLSISSAGDILQILSDEPSLADLTSALPLSTGGVLLGTQRAGLIVWDGEALRRVHSQLTGQEVTALAGEDGDLWIGTLNQGVLHWSGGSLKQFGEEQGLPDKQVLSLAAGSAGVYVGTPIGVASFRDGAFERVLADGFFAAALHLSDVTLMVGTIDEGTIELPLGQERQPRSTGPRIAASGPDNVTAFASSGSSVVAATSSAAYLRAADSSSWRSLFETSGAGLRDRNVAALHVDSSNRLWTGYFDRGLDVLDAAFERVAEIENDEIFCVNRIKAAQDNGTTAVATANGLAYFDASARMRQFLTHADGLISSHVTDVAFTNDGTILATPAGLTFLDSSGTHSLYAFHGLVNNHVYALGATANQLLAGTLGGLSVLHGGRVTSSFTTANSSLAHNWVSAISSFGGDWFIGLYGGGVMRLTPKGEWTAYPPLRGVEINPNAMISSGSRVYAGTLDRGLLVFDPGAETWRFVTDGLPSKNVTALALAGDTLYVGSDNGLSRVSEMELTGR